MFLLHEFVYCWTNEEFTVHLQALGLPEVMGTYKVEWWKLTLGTYCCFQPSAITQIYSQLQAAAYPQVKAVRDLITCTLKVNDGGGSGMVVSQYGRGPPSIIRPLLLSCDLPQSSYEVQKKGIDSLISFSTSLLEGVLRNHTQSPLIYCGNGYSMALGGLRKQSHDLCSPFCSGHVVKALMW